MARAPGKPERYETLHSSVVNALLGRLSRDDVQCDRSELNRLPQRRRGLCEASTEGDSKGGLMDRPRKTDRPKTSSRKQPANRGMTLAEEKRRLTDALKRKGLKSPFK
jgi:hypothetical protein